MMDTKTSSTSELEKMEATSSESEVEILNVVMSRLTYWQYEYDVCGQGQRETDAGAAVMYANEGMGSLKISSK